MSWTDERISLLKRLCGEGKSAREIATALGEGVTRNAVIGKINRMKLAERKAEASKSKPAPSAASKPKKARPKPKASASSRKLAESGMSQPSSPSPPSPPSPPPPPAAEPAPSSPSRESQEPLDPAAPLIREPDEDGDIDEDVKGASLFGEGGCKWPTGHPGEEDFHFCGERRYETLPYCRDHAQEAYQMTERRRGRSS